MFDQSKIIDDDPNLPLEVEEQFELFRQAKLFDSGCDMQRRVLRELLRPETQAKFSKTENGMTVLMDCYDSIYARKGKTLASEGRPIPKRYTAPVKRDPSRHPGKHMIQVLRRKLKTYYAHTGRFDPVKIRIPKGLYNPEVKIATEIVADNEINIVEVGERSVVGAQSARLINAPPRAFQEFFGAPRDHHSGVIVLQSEQIEELLESRELLRELEQTTGRVYKARTWVNTSDVHGATFIQSAFREQGINAPRLVFSDHHTRHVSARYKISLGLGFSYETFKTIQNKSCEPWMRISRSSGDALSLHELLSSPNKSERLTSEPDSERTGFRRLLPSDWSDTWIKSWLRKTETVVQDYAMLFRHTHAGPNRQVLFVVAGFTERSTSIGAQYLANNWTSLWRKYVAGPKNRRSLGDFLHIIEGPSDPDRAKDWSEVEEFCVTPETLRRTGIKCEWADRITRRGRGKVK